MIYRVDDIVKYEIYRMDVIVKWDFKKCKVKKPPV